MSALQCCVYVTGKVITRIILVGLQLVQSFSPCLFSMHLGGKSTTRENWFSV